ncbi:MAG: hypothetical protein AAF544_04125 [Bacteroidota bacterium]
MSSFFTSFFVIAGVFALGFVLINLRYVVTGQEFRGTCASNNPMLKDQVGECTVCGKKAGEECKGEDGMATQRA